MDSKQNRKEVTIMQEVIREYLEQAKVGRKQAYRLCSQKVTGFALGLDDRVLHLSIFARINENGREISGARISRFSRRARYRM